MLQASLQQRHCSTADIEIPYRNLQLAIFDHGRQERGFPQAGSLQKRIGADGGFQVRTGLLHCRLDIGKERTDLSWNRGTLIGSLRRSLDCGRNRTTPAMAHHQDHIGSQDGGGILQTRDNLRGDDVARHAGDKKLADGLVEDHLHRHARIGAGKNRGKRFLLLHHLLQNREITSIGRTSGRW